MRNILSLTLLSLASLSLVLATDYCKKSCGSSQNIGCNNDGVSHRETEKQRKREREREVTN